MAIENDPSARMQLRTRGELVHPGSCMVCGSGTCDEGYLDLGVFFDYEGTMYLCHTCATQAGETIGMFTPDQVNSQLSLLEQLTQENAKYKEELDNVRPLVDAVNRLRQPSDSIDPHAPTIVDFVREESESLPAVIEPESVSSDDDSVKFTDGSDSGKPEPEKPVKITKRSGTSRPTARDITF